MVMAGNTEHVSQVPTDRHTVRCSPKGGDPDEWVTVEYAVSRLEGYYRDDPQGWIRETLASGTPLQTMSYWYVIPGIPVHAESGSLADRIARSI